MSKENNEVEVKIVAPKAQPEPDIESDEPDLSLKSFRNFCCALCCITCFVTTAGAITVFIVTNAISITLIAFGTIYIHDCPQKNIIPISLLGQGVANILQSFLRYWKTLCTCSTENKEKEENSKFQSALWFIAMVWFIIGSVAVYSEYEPNYDETVDSEKYCNKTLYLFAFYYNTITYAIVALIIVVILLMGCFFGCKLICGKE